MEVGSKTNDEETKVFAIAKILYYKINYNIIRAAVRFCMSENIVGKLSLAREIFSLQVQA